ncbi:MAG: MtrB/PioB family outer membrane beta-barrel protein [Elusimicrobia bacterium]|nr:MtrB/PioB family outer membrane beta-barrel protein [Elusimicrobiota bacterium]
MKIKHLCFMTSFLFGGSFLTSALAETKISQDVEVGVQGVSVNTSEAKFEEYGEVPNGPFMNYYSMDVDAEKYDLSFFTRRPSLDDQSAELNYDRGGKLWFNAGYAQNPHRWANSSVSLYNEVSPGVLALPDGMQGTLQTFGNTTANWFNVMNSTFAGLAHTEELYVRGDRSSVNLGFAPAPQWAVNLDLYKEKKAGKQMGMFGFGRNYAVEMARTVDQTVYDSALGLAYSGKRLSMGMKYGFNSFKNDVDKLTFDSYRRQTDIVGSLTSGVGASKGQGSVQPDNIAQSFAANLGLDVAPKTRFEADASYTYMRQNADLLPHTVNTAAAASADPLPEKSADTKNAFWVQNYRLTHQLTQSMALGARLRSEQMGDNSKHMDFGGHVAMDQLWEADDWATHRFGYRKNNTGLTMDWNLSKAWLFGAEAFNETATREMRNFKETSDDNIIGRLEFHPAPTFKVRARYTNAYRSASDYEAPSSTTVELAGLRYFDIAARARNAGDLSVTGWKGALSYGLNGGFATDKFNSGDGPTNDDVTIATNNVAMMYGLLHSHTATAGADLALDVSSQVGFFGFYQFQWIRGVQRSNRSGGGSPTSDVQEIWEVQTTDRYDVVGVGVDLRPVERLKFVLAYDLSHSEGAMDYLTVNAGNSTTLKAPPETVTTKQVYRLDGEIKASSNLTCTLGYTREDYKIHDFANQNLGLTSGQAAGQTNVTLADNSEDYKAHIVSARLNLRW